MKFEVKKSPIHGLGVFAKIQIKKGEYIGRYVSRKTDRDGCYVLWVESEHGVQGYEGYGRLRFLNHQGRPNSRFDGLTLYATRNIRPSDEITIHYGQAWKKRP